MMVPRVAERAAGLRTTKSAAFTPVTGSLKVSVKATEDAVGVPAVKIEVTGGVESAGGDATKGMLYLGAPALGYGSWYAQRDDANGADVGFVCEESDE